MRTKVTVYALMALFLLISCETKIDDPHGVDDPEAKLYRMYIDNGEGDLTLKKFNGRLQLADIESRFGPLEQLVQDSLGNYIGGWKYMDEKYWSLVVGPNLNSINLVSMDKEGTISSAVDLDGDRIAEIVDIRLEDQTRFTFADELMGMEFLEFWLLNQNPFCNEQEIPGIDYPIMNCDEEGSSSSSGLKGSGIIDFFEKLCQENYGSQPSISTGGVIHESGPGGTNRRREFPPVTQHDDQIGHVKSQTQTTITWDAHGNVIRVVRDHVEYDPAGNIIREIHEDVDQNGWGIRTETVHNRDGSSETTEYNFDADIEEYAKDTKYENPVPPEGSGTSVPYPGPVDGPFGSESDLEAWCEATTPYESGVEQAATRDPSAFRLSCDDLVVSNTGGSDCTIIEWARPGDFTGVLDPPSTNSGCGPFEQPGEDGSCGPVSGVQRLLGQTAEVVSANLGEIVLCDPIVCNPGI